MKRIGMQIITALVAAAASAGILSCGSSDNGNSTSAPLTKAEFVKAGDRICQERLAEKDEIVRETLSKLPPSQAAKPSHATLTELGESILEPVRKLTTEFSELQVSADSKPTAAKITHELEAGLKQAESDPTTLVQTNPFLEAGKSAQAYGFKACSF